MFLRKKCRCGGPPAATYWTPKDSNSDDSDSNPGSGIDERVCRVDWIVACPLQSGIGSGIGSGEQLRRSETDVVLAGAVAMICASISPSATMHTIWGAMKLVVRKHPDDR